VDRAETSSGATKKIKQNENRDKEAQITHQKKQ
jgi:hypothetical protein